jgi:hypothetical protein
MDPSEPITNGCERVLRMNAAFPGREWIATLMDCSGCSLDYVEWHHQEEMVPPQAMLTAAGLLLAKAEVDRDGGTL